MESAVAVRRVIAKVAVGVGWSAYRVIHEDDPDGISDHLGLVGYKLAFVLTGILAWRWLLGA